MTEQDPPLSPALIDEVGGLEVVFLTSEKLRHDLQSLLSSARSLDDQTSAEQRYHAWELGMHVFSRAWFTRMWTLQEFILPPRLQIRCGRTSIDAESLSLCSRVYFFAIFGPMPDAFLDRFQLYERLYSVCSTRALFHNAPLKRQRHIVERVIRYRNREATDPRDRIYALLSISAGASFGVDYVQSAEEVYTRFAAWCIREGMIEQIMKNVSGIRARSCVPTWVPDWRDEVGMTTNLNFQDSDHRPYGGAGGHAKETRRFSEDLRTLYVDGVMLSQIAVVLRGLTWNYNFVEHFRKRLQEWYGFNDPQPSGQSLEEAILRTLRADVASLDDETSKPERFGAACPSHDVFHEYPYDDYHLFFTTSGYLGLTKEDTGQKGDFVAVVRGITLPVILRQQDTHFEIVSGDSYVHGIMDGEIMAEVDSGKRTLEEIELR